MNIDKQFKIFNQMQDDELNSNIYKTDANHNLKMIFLGIGFLYLFAQYGLLLILNINEMAIVLLSEPLLSLTKLFGYIIYIAIIIHTIYIVTINFHHYRIKIKLYKTNPIYHFMKQVNRSIANQLYSDLDYLWKMYLKKKQHDNLETIKLIKRQTENDSEYLLEKLDDEIFKTLETDHVNGNIKNLLTIKASDFETYRKLFMRFIMPNEMECLKNKFKIIEQKFAYKENNISPVNFSKMLDNLKVRLDETERFSENDYVEYTRRYSFLKYKINNIS